MSVATEVDLRAIAERGAAELGPDATAEQVLAWAASTFGGRMIVASNMQDAVLVDLAAAALPGLEVLFLETGYHFAETIGTRDAVEHAYDVKIVNAKARRSVALQDIEFGKDLFARDPNLCCAMRKVEPLTETLAGYDAWVTGVRRVEAPTRANTPLVTYDEKFGLVKINPIAAWSDDDMEAYIAEHDILVNPLVGDGVPVDRVRPVHRQAAAGRRPALRPLGGHRQDRVRTARPMTVALDALEVLESEAIHIFREVAGEFDRPVILFSGGKDSTLLVHLAMKAFAPAPVPFPLLHVDTGHNYPEVIAFRDTLVERLGLRLHVAHVQHWIDDGRLVERPDGTRNPLQTQPLLDTIVEHRFDAVFGGGRRDEERARAKERIISLRDAFGRWDPRSQRPELWNLYNGRHAPGEHVRVFPISNWTELDVWRYIARENIELPSIYYSHDRDVFRRDGMWLAEGPWGGPRGTESLERKTVRYRTVGDGSCTGAVESEAATVDEIIAEVMASRLTERGATRADDRLSEAAMEDRKREGYF